MLRRRERRCAIGSRAHAEAAAAAAGLLAFEELEHHTDTIDVPSGRGFSVFLCGRKSWMYKSKMTTACGISHPRTDHRFPLHDLDLALGSSSVDLYDMGGSRILLIL